MILKETRDWLACLLLALALPQVALAYSRVQQSPASAGGKSFQIQFSTQTASFLQREAYAADGVTVLRRETCSVLGSYCFGALPPGTSKFVVTLEGYNAAREEIISELCKGVLSTIPQLQCKDGDLVINMRPRLGTLNVVNTFVPGTFFARILGAFTGVPRLVFAEDPTKYWEAYGGTVPAGNYAVTQADRVQTCKPVQASATTVSVPANGTGTANVVYRMTECPVTVDVDTSYTKTYSLTGGTFTCVPRSSFTDRCTGVATYGANLNLSATVPAGYTPHFERPCSGVFPRQACNVRADDEVVLNMGVIPVASPPPPPPPPPAVQLKVSQGSDSPGNATYVKGAVDVPLLQLYAEPQNGTAQLTAVTLAASGTGRDDLDLTAIRVIHDVNQNGMVDVSETVLATGRLAADNGTLRLVLGTPLSISAPINLLVVADVNTTVTVASAAGVLGGSGLVLLAAMGPWSGRRREGGKIRSRALALVLGLALAAWLLVSCGGADPAPADTTAAAVPTPLFVSPIPDPSPLPPPLPPVATYQLRVTGLEATNSAVPPVAITVTGAPVAGGAVISVEK